MICLLGLPHHRVDFQLAPDIVANGELGGAGRRLAETGVVREVVTRPDRQFHAGLQVEERHGPVLELAADDPASRQTKPIPVKGHGPFEVVDPEREQRDPGLHGSFLFMLCSQRGCASLHGRMRYALGSSA